MGAPFETAFTRCWHILKMVKDVTAAKSELAFTRYCYANARNLDGKNSLQDLRIYQSRSKSVQKCSIFIIFRCLHDAFSKMCRLEFYRFQDQPAKMCRFRANGRPIRQIFHRFQNVPASCERSLRKEGAEASLTLHFFHQPFSGQNPPFVAQKWWYTMDSLSSSTIYIFPCAYVSRCR